MRLLLLLILCLFLLISRQTVQDHSSQTLLQIGSDVEDILKMVSERSIEIFNSDYMISHDHSMWYMASDVCAVHQRIFAFPVSLKLLIMAMDNLGERSVWVDLFNTKWGWLASGGIYNVNPDWLSLNPPKYEEGLCGLLKSDGVIAAANCTESHQVLCLNPTILDAQHQEDDYQV